VKLFLLVRTITLLSLLPVQLVVLQIVFFFFANGEIHYSGIKELQALSTSVDLLLFDSRIQLFASSSTKLLTLPSTKLQADGLSC
jgi:hypothetical protein